MENQTNEKQIELFGHQTSIKKMGGNKTKMELFVEKNQKVQSVLFEKIKDGTFWTFGTFWFFWFLIFFNKEK